MERRGNESWGIIVGPVEIVGIVGIVGVVGLTERSRLQQRHKLNLNLTDQVSRPDRPTACLKDVLYT